MTDRSHTSKPLRRFAVIGGDLRMLHLSERLQQEGHTVCVLGCGQDCLPARKGSGELRICSTLQSAAEGADILILPLPASKDGVTVYCPREPDCTVTLAEVAEQLTRSPEARLFGGKLPADFSEAMKGLGIPAHRIQDYYRNEGLQLRNACLTAEAALMTAMELTDFALQNTSVAVLGYGRIGKHLSRLLRAMGANVTVCARREESLSEAAAEGCHPLRITDASPLGGLSPLMKREAVLFNTIPAPILSRELLLGLEPDTLLLDLASAPFGVSDRDVREAAAKNGLRYLRAPSLPGSYAPRDAGYAIAECILDTLTEWEAPEPLPLKGGDAP